MEKIYGDDDDDRKIEWEKKIEWKNCVKFIYFNKVSKSRK
jgi:hypothetical protein